MGGEDAPVLSPGGSCARPGVLDVASCPTGHVWTRWRPCLRLRCDACRDRVSARRARRLYDRLGRRGFLVLVVTWPGSWRHLAGPAHLRAWRLGVRIVLRSWLEGELRAGVGALEWWHPSGEHRPGADLGHQDGPGAMESEVHPHLNYLIPLGMIRAERPSALCWPGCSPGWIPPDALERLKAALQALFDDFAAELGLAPAAINVFAEYRRGRKKALHALKYFGRSWPLWGSAMSQLGTGARLWALSSAFARSCADERRRLMRYLRPKKEEAEAQECPICTAPLQLRGGQAGVPPHEAGYQGGGRCRGPPIRAPIESTDGSWFPPSAGAPAWDHYARKPGRGGA